MATGHSAGNRRDGADFEVIEKKWSMTELMSFAAKVCTLNSAM